MISDGRDEAVRNSEPIEPMIVPRNATAGDTWEINLWNLQIIKHD